MGKQRKQPSITFNGPVITMDLTDDKHAQAAVRCYLYNLSRSGLCHQRLIMQLHEVVNDYTQKKTDIEENRFSRIMPVRRCILNLFEENYESNFVRAEIIHHVSQDEDIMDSYNNYVTGAVDASLRWLVQHQLLTRSDIFRQPHEKFRTGGNKGMISSYAYCLTGQEKKIAELSVIIKNDSYKRVIVNTDDIEKLEQIRGYKGIHTIFGRPENDNAQFIASSLRLPYKYFLVLPDPIPEDCVLIS